MAVAGLLLCVTSLANAGIIEVDYILSDGGIEYTGNFAGEDINSNGILESNELTVFISDNYFLSHGDLLDNGWTDFGDFIITSDTWVANGIDWHGVNNAYFTWQDQRNSWNTSWIDGVSTTITSAPSVPEPSTLAIFALGMIGLASRRFKKQP
jgi:hypothetical protein